jgi:predicted acyltransferase
VSDNSSQERLLSLDVLRGLTLVGMILVNSMAAMKYDAGAAVFPLLLHSHWEGMTLADLVFPSFLTMVGVSIPLAMAGSSSKPKPDVHRAILVRTIRLFVLGMILSNLYWLADLSSGDWRLFGVLQRIGLVYGACAFLFLASGPKVRITIAVAILVLYWPVTLVPALDGLPNDIWQRGHNFVASVDRVLLGAGNHNYVTGPTGYDPEGLLGTLPAIAHGLIGVAIGEYILRRPAHSARNLAIAGATMLTAGICWGLVFPVVKDIWSSSFVLVTSGITVLVLSGLHAWLDRSKQLNLPTRLFVLFGTAFGLNSIAAYVIHQITASMTVWQALLLPYEATRGTIGQGWASFLPVGLYITFIWLCCEYLRRRRWIIKI